MARLSIVSACMQADGTPALVMNDVEVSAEEAENGVQFQLVERELIQQGYDEPFVHFRPNESPQFLHAAVRRRPCPATV